MEINANMNAKMNAEMNLGSEFTKRKLCSFASSHLMP